jgi:hypothetical protein
MASTRDRIDRAQRTASRERAGGESDRVLHIRDVLRSPVASPPLVSRMGVPPSAEVGLLANGGGGGGMDPVDVVDALDDLCRSSSSASCRSAVLILTKSCTDMDCCGMNRSPRLARAAAANLRRSEAEPPPPPPPPPSSSEPAAGPDGGVREPITGETEDGEPATIPLIGGLTGGLNGGGGGSATESDPNADMDDGGGGMEPAAGDISL